MSRLEVRAQRNLLLEILRVTDPCLQMVIRSFMNFLRMLNC